MGKQNGKGLGKDNKQNSSSHQKNNQHTTKKQIRKPDKNRPPPPKIKGNKDDGDNKIRFVMAPKKILEKRAEIKDLEKTEKAKSFQKQKQKRNSAFLKKTKNGQPDLGSRMKVLYSQIQKSFESGT